MFLPLIPGCTVSMGLSDAIYDLGARMTPSTQRLLRHWRSHPFANQKPFFCQVEAVETVIWLTEVAPKASAQGRRVTILSPSAEHTRISKIERRRPTRNKAFNPCHAYVCSFNMGRHIFKRV